MPVDQAVGAIEECGAPMVSIAGGEPLIHPEIDEIVRQLIARKRYVYLCTNGLLMERKLRLFKPSPYFSWAVHIDGLRERHDESVCREGVFDKAVAGDPCRQVGRLPGDDQHDLLHARLAETVRQVLDFLNDELEGRPDDDLAGLRLREGARPGALPRRQADP